MRTLRPYQTSCLDSIKKFVSSGKRKMLCHLATGAGKTVILSELPKTLNCKRTLVIAHREELLKQAQAKLQDAGLSAEIEQAGQHAGTTCSVVVASVQSLNTNGRLFKFNPTEFDLVIVDECHHSTAKSYLRIVNYFSSAVVVGFTATPYRADEADLLEVFTDGFAYSMDRDDLTERGYLVPIHKVECIVPSLNAEHVLEVYKELGEGKKTIVFCQDVDHTVEISECFNAAGIEALSVHGGMGKEHREEALRSFNKNGTKVLANCGILTEGYDEPSVQCVILARNTSSRSLYEQMIGRGVRLFEGKTHLKVIELFAASPKAAPKSKAAIEPMAKSFVEKAQDAFWIFVVLVLLAASIVGLGVAVKHCNHELTEMHTSVPQVLKVVKEKAKKAYDRKYHRHNSRSRAYAKRGSKASL
jgi:superfamily II DNA or RNA helicase